MDRVAVFARYPRVGQVKTRLSPAVPPALALDLHAAMLADTLECALATRAGPPLLYWASEPEGFPVPPGLEVRNQKGADLGDRLAAAFAELLSRPEDRAVVIGTDCPDLTPDLVREAFATLGRHEAVLGPADDGGYYLIGLSRQAPELFRGIAWGTGSVLAQTLERAKGAGLNVAMLGALWDIDTPEDLVRFVARRSITSPGTGARTEEALRELGLLPPRT
jgi:uncharacterized protein